MSATKEYLKEWRKQNKEHIKKYHKGWRIQNRSLYKQYYLNNFKGRSLPENPDYISQKSNLIGKKYGEWTVLDEYIERTNKRRYFLVRCSCGLIKCIQKYTVTSGESTSCGHWRRKNHNRLERRFMTADKKIEQLIAHNVKSLTISKKKYDSLKEETKNLIKLNDIKLNFEEEK